VSGCCARGYERFFGARAARRDAKRYRRRGLDGTAQRLVDELDTRGVERATVVELSRGYDDAAAGLAREAGAEELIERRHGDFVDEASLVGDADVVVMHRVVCCYPDPERLVGAAAERTRRLLALSFPRDTWWLRWAARAANVFFRLTGGIETYIHPPEVVERSAERAGLTTVLHEPAGRIWRVAVFERR
jgi:magnesium-protoporphyrin O-methyltransferase